MGSVALCRQLATTAAAKQKGTLVRTVTFCSLCPPMFPGSYGVWLTPHAPCSAPRFPLRHIESEMFAAVVPIPIRHSRFQHHVIGRFPYCPAFRVEDTHQPSVRIDVDYVQSPSWFTLNDAQQIVVRIATSRLIPLRRVDPVHPDRVFVTIRQPNPDGVTVDHPHHVNQIVLSHESEHTCATIFAMTRLQIAPGLSLDVADQGDGPLLILIAGGMMDMDQWAQVADALSDSHRVVRYDQRGIGESDQPTEGYTVDQFAEDAVNLIRALDSGPAVLIGNSLGGTVAMGAAFLAPELVRGIVTCSTSAGPTGPPTPPETMQYMMRGAQLPVPQAAAAMMDILFATDFIDEHPDMLDDAVEKRSKGAPMIATLGPLQSALIFDPIERLKTLGIPMLVLHGEEDVLVLPDHAQLLADAAGADSRLIASAGHALVVEQSDAVVEALSSFLADLEA